MKRFIIPKLFVVMVLSFSLSSCFKAVYQVGSGSQTGVTAEGKNQYFIYGLAPGKQADVEQMANGQTDYTIHTEQSFVDGLLSVLTFGIYTPTTVKVQR